MNTVYNIQEVAKILNTTQKAVRRIVASGDIESSKVGTRYSITKQALEKYQNQSKNKISEKGQQNLFGEPEETKQAYTPKMPNLVDISAWW